MLRRFLFLILAAGALAMPALAAYPEKPIRLIVPSAPGGAPDALMRALAQQLSQQMGVPIVIDNKPGGSYTIGTMELVHAAPDGYTLAYGNVVSLATNRSLLPNVPYDVDRDLTLVSNALKLSNLMIVNKDLPVKSVSELIAYAKKNPGKLAFASDGNGTTAHLGVELFKAMTGVHMLHVPYRAATAALTDLIGGGIQSDDGQHAGIGSAGAGRPGARYRDLLSTALADLPGRAGNCRDGAGIRGHRVGRHHRSGQSAEGHRGETQRRNSHGPGQPRGTRALQDVGRRPRSEHARGVPSTVAT